MRITLLSLLLITTTMNAEPIKYYFENARDGLRYTGNGWSVRSDGDRGWVSLKIGDAEFLHSMAMQQGDRLITCFPDRQNLSHDESVGRMGYVSDGINMIRFSPDRQKPEVELYDGANEKADQRLLMFLADGVTVDGGTRSVASAGSLGHDGAWPSNAIAGLILRHPGGVTLSLREPVTTEKINGRLAVVFPCKGFAANAYHFSMPAAPKQFPEVTGVRFDVKSSDDPPKGNLFDGAAYGACNPVYGPNTKLDYGIVFKPASSFSGRAELEVIHSLGQPHYFETVALTGTTNKEVRVQFQPKFNLPGVSEVWCRLISADNELIWLGRYRMAWDWEHYRPKIQVQPDFNEFWDATLQELRATPLEPQATRVFEDHPKFEMYDVTFNSWGKQRTHAMLFVPKGATNPLPAIVTAHPGTTGFGLNKRPDGVYGSEVKQDQRFVTIVPLIRGHAPDAKEIPFNHPWWGPLGDRDTYVARAWYCAMTRAVDYLATRPDLVDMKRVVVKGGSQGGALALVTAALDPRVAVCLSDCPANCQPQEIIENYPSFGPSKGCVPAGKTLAAVERALSYYNPVNFAPRIKCPTYVGSNIGDLTVHSMGPLAAYHNLTGVPADQKDFYPGRTHAHGSGPGLAVKTKEWLERLSPSH